MFFFFLIWNELDALQCVLPAGIEFHASGFDPKDPSTFPRTYPIVLTGKEVSTFNIVYVKLFDLSCYLSLRLLALFLCFTSLPSAWIRPCIVVFPFLSPCMYIFHILPNDLSREILLLLYMNHLIVLFHYRGWWV